VLTQLQNNNVLLVDCDLRKPVLHKIFGYRNLTGIVSVLAGEYSMQDVWHGPEPGLKLITVGPIPPNPAELLSSQRFANFIEQARKEFDYVVLDASPIELVTDPTILAALCDGVLLVINAQTTRKRSARRSVQRLEAVGAQILGTVMNDAEGSVGSYYSSTYY
jgi:receptor protein-tyrosine kinase